MDKSNGWVNIDRNIMQRKWYSHAPSLALYIHCQLVANWEDREWKGITVKRGSFVTTVAKLMKALTLTRQPIRTAIANLEKSGDITIETTNKYTVITVVGYGFKNVYKDIKPTTQPIKTIPFNQETVEDIANSNVHYITERLFNNSLISDKEITIFDDVITDCLEMYDAVDVAIKSEYVLKQMENKTINNRFSYFKMALYNNLKTDYQGQTENLYKLDVNLSDEDVKFLKQFE